MGDESIFGLSRANYGNSVYNNFPYGQPAPYFDRLASIYGYNLYFNSLYPDNLIGGELTWPNLLDAARYGQVVAPYSNFNSNLLASTQPSKKRVKRGKTASANAALTLRK